MKPVIIRKRSAEGLIRASQEWKNFLNFLQRREDSNWMFRGVSDSKRHKLRPKIGRTDVVPKGGYSIDGEKRIFGGFKRRARAYIHGQVKNDWEWLAVAQHHGLPTRLLDWTSNPLVAAFFAVSGQKAENSSGVYAINTANHSIVDTDRNPDPFEVNDVKFVVPVVNDARLVSQRGFFTIHSSPDTDWEPQNIEDNFFEIPYDACAYFRRKLFSFGVDAAHIMADLDGLCQTLQWQYSHAIAVSKLS